MCGIIPDLRKLISVINSLLVCCLAASLSAKWSTVDEGMTRQINVSHLTFSSSSYMYYSYFLFASPCFLKSYSCQHCVRALLFFNFRTEGVCYWFRAGHRIGPLPFLLWIQCILEKAWHSTILIYKNRYLYNLLISPSCVLLQAVSVPKKATRFWWKMIHKTTLFKLATTDLVLGPHR
jgi:hypothetical protein